MLPSFASQLPSYKQINIPQTILRDIIQLTSHILGHGEILIELFTPINPNPFQKNISLPSNTWLEKRIYHHFSKNSKEIFSLNNVSNSLKNDFSSMESRQGEPYSIMVSPSKHGNIFILISKASSITFDSKQVERLENVFSLVTTLLPTTFSGQPVRYSEKSLYVKDTEEPTELLFYHSPIPKYLLDIDTFSILKANKRMLDHFNWEPTSLVGKKITDILITKEVKLFLNSIQSIINLSTPVNLGTFSHVTKNGVSTRFELIGSYLGFLRPKSILIACYDVTEKEEKFLQLKNSEDRLKIAAKINQIGYWRMNPYKNSVTLSQEAYRIWGMNKKLEFNSYTSLLKTIHPQDQYLFPAPNKHLSNKKQYDTVFRIILPDNSIKWVRKLILKTTLEGNKRQVLEGFFQDITKQTKELKQQELREAIGKIFNQEKHLPNCLNKVLHHVVEFGGYTFGEIWLPNLEYNHLTLTAQYSSNETGTAFYQESVHIRSISYDEGLPGRVFKKQNIEEWDPTDSKVDFKRRKAARKAGIHKTIGIPLFHHKEFIGVMLLGASKHQKIPTSDRNFLKSLETHIGSELQRKLNEQELSQIISCIPDLLVIVNTQGYIKKINPASAKLIGYSEQELLEKPIFEIVHPEDSNAIIRNIRFVRNEQINFKDGFEHGQFPIHETVNRYITKDGKIKWLKWRYTGALQKGLILAVGKDISHEVNLNKQLEMVNSIAQIGSWEMNPKSKVIDWCPITRRIYQVDDKFNPTLENYRQFTKHESDFQHLMKLFEKCINNELQNFDYPFPIITPNGEECWIRVVGRGEYINNCCTGIYGKTQNIHQFKTIELAYRKAYKDKNRILNSIRDAFISVDNNWIIKYWNRSAELLMNINRKDALESNLWEIFPNLIKQFDQIIDTVDSLKSLHYNYFEVFNDDIEKWLEISVYPAPSGMSFYIKDISTRIAARKKLEASNERFEKATQAASDIIYDRCLKSNSLFLSKAFNTIFGHSLNPESQNLPFWLEHIHKEDKYSIIKELNKAIKNPEIKKWKGEYRFLKSNREYAHVSDNCLIIRDEQGNPIRAIGAITDVTQQKKYEKSLLDLNNKLMIYSEKMEIQNQQLRDIAWTQSHIVRAPVARILGIVDLILGDLLDENEKVQMLKQIESSTMELDDIIKEVVSKTNPITPINKNLFGL